MDSKTPIKINVTTPELAKKPHPLLLALGIWLFLTLILVVVFIVTKSNESSSSLEQKTSEAVFVDLTEEDFDKVEEISSATASAEEIDGELVMSGFSNYRYYVSLLKFSKVSETEVLNPESFETLAKIVSDYFSFAYPNFKYLVVSDVSTEGDLTKVVDANEEIVDELGTSFEEVFEENSSDDPEVVEFKDESAEEIGAETLEEGKLLFNLASDTGEVFAVEVSVGSAGQVGIKNIKIKKTAGEIFNYDLRNYYILEESSDVNFEEAFEEDTEE